jgi:hypothetical protein
MSNLSLKLEPIFSLSSEDRDRSQELFAVAEAAYRAAEVAEDHAEKVDDAVRLRACATWYRAEANRIYWQGWQGTILFLQQEWRRIEAWIRIQDEKKEGKYPAICSDLICLDPSFTVLTEVLMFLEAATKETAVQARTIEDPQVLTWVIAHSVYTAKVGYLLTGEVGITFHDRDTRTYGIHPDTHKVFIEDSNRKVSIVVPDPVKIAVNPDGIRIHVRSKENLTFTGIIITLLDGALTRIMDNYGGSAPIVTTITTDYNSLRDGYGYNIISMISAGCLPFSWQKDMERAESQLRQRLDCLQ